ncbi:hypothetical protein K458DRAFT_394614 [Lentithecium fluviatile CBS 122367]|uniref:Uncharacterized protein n=1 Tax=Lentithecium fluviatile CBS 122367 TaxID=1168545 RepID=A0A6G1ILI8_9PLEO|nr:hypothetical protein K458DRAFT_394614 [Lentithecium fluviatile CBS 122367]
MASNLACHCPNTSDSVKQGLIWGCVIFLVAFFTIIRCWRRDRREAKERRRARIWRETHLTTQWRQADNEELSSRQPPPPYDANHDIHLGLLEAQLHQAFDVEGQLPSAPERAALREGRRDHFIHFYFNNRIFITTTSWSIALAVTPEKQSDSDSAVVHDRQKPKETAAFIYKAIHTHHRRLPQSLHSYKIPNFSTTKTTSPRTSMLMAVVNDAAIAVTVFVAIILWLFVTWTLGMSQITEGVYERPKDESYDGP